MKRLWKIVLAVAVLAAVILVGMGVMSEGAYWTGIGEVSEGRVIVHDESSNMHFEDVMTEEELRTVARILDGRFQISAKWEIPSCGFDENISVEIDGERYAVALDSCGTLLVVSSGHYISVSDADMAVIREVFEKRGYTPHV